MVVPLAPIAAVTAAGLANDIVRVAGKQGMTLMGHVGKAALSNTPIRSLTDIGKASRVEPLVLIDKPLRDAPYMEDVLKTVLSTFTGYYLQAAALMINIKRVETLRVLDSLNPQRGSLFNRKAVSDVVFSKEAYQHGLPSLESFSQPCDPRVIVSIESDALTQAQIDETRTRDLLGQAKIAETEARTAAIKEQMKRDADAPKPARSGGTAGTNDDIKRLYEVESLAVGKMIQIEFTEGNETTKIPVMVRLIPTEVPSQVLTHIFTATSKNTSWKERYHLWRAGQISFVRDLLFSTDIIDEHRKALINDTSNVYMAVTDRRRHNASKEILTGTPSLADASNIAVLHQSTAREIGKALYGKIDSLSVRKKLFDATYLILLVVVDDEWERITIYHRGLDTPTTLSFKEIKSAEKGKGPDITEVLRAYQLGSTPTF